MSQRTDSANTTDRAPIELHAAPNPVSSTTQSDVGLFLNGDVTLSTVVRHVEIVVLCWEFTSYGIDVLDYGEYVAFFTHLAHCGLCASCIIVSPTEIKTK